MDPTLPPMDPNMLVAAFATIIQQLPQFNSLATTPASLSGPGVAPSQVHPGLPSQGAPAPRATSYTSTRTALAGIPPSAHGHPNPTTTLGPPAVYQPFLGTSSLAVPMAGNTNQPRLGGRPRSRSIDRPSRSEVSGANHSRNRAIEAHFPPTPSLPPRLGRRPRGRAAGTPNLPISPTSVASVFAIDPETNKQVIKLDIHVYLHTLSSMQLHLVRNLAESFEQYLKDHNLHFAYALPPDTKIVDLAHRVATEMSSSDTKWCFPEPSSALRLHLRRHETLHLQLLGLVNRGVARRDSCIGLRPQPTNSFLTLADLFFEAKFSAFYQTRLMHSQQSSYPEFYRSFCRHHWTR
ncbi:hypothetical protein C8R45DRAFT_1114836 [Mycena sanguinolenta]|nr:hypothetical protein C8R45DRAFT_1114836 [Mycena sanguinolenta]